MIFIKTRDEFLNESFSDNFDFVDKQDLENFVKSLNLPYSKIEILGEGGYGLAIDLGDSVLKITHDESEVYFANMLKNIDSKHLVKIYDVWYNKFYIIHQEKLFTNINETIKTFLYYLHIRNPLTIDSSNADVCDYFTSKMHITDDMIIKLFDMWKSVASECIKYNIPLSDFHEKNVGYRKSDPTCLVYFDISDPYDYYSEKIKDI